MKKIIINIFLILSYIFTLNTAYSFEKAAMLGATFGEIRGFSQTPMGGSENTTSIERPRFNEFTKNQDLFWDFKLTANFQNFFKLNSFLVLRYINLDDTKNLKEDLLTHSKIIKQNESFNAQVKYLWYGIGFNRFFKINNNFKIAPQLELDILNYKYNYNASTNYNLNPGPGYTSSQRAFNLFAATYGLALDYKLANNLNLVSDIWLPLPLSNMRKSEANLGLVYTQKFKSFYLKPALNTGFFRADMHDAQHIPNHIQYFMRPYIRLSVSFSDFN